MLTPEQLADLRAKAQAATPGPWHTFIDGTCIWKNIEDLPSGCIGECYREEDRDFIAAANPATVLKLLDMVERLEKGRDWLIEALNGS